MARRSQPGHGAVARLVRRYRATQWNGRAALREYQQERIRELFAHCWWAVPYYRRLFEWQGATEPGEVSFDRLPVLTKSELHRSFEDLKARDLGRRRWRLNRSGGSTGQPVAFIQDQDYLSHSEAKKAVCFEWAGYCEGDLLVRLWGSERDILGGGVGWRARAKSYLSNRTTLDAFVLTPTKMQRYIDIIDRVRPRCLHAYAQAAFELARFAKRHSRSVQAIGGVVSTSGVLYPFMRETIEDVFGCPVFDQYGSREVSCIASEVPDHHGMHVNMETLVVEVLDPAGRPCEPGVDGEIVVTSLVNYAMPLIRYRTGDRGTLDEGDCGCGRGLQVLKRVSGRAMDCFRLADGSLIPGEYFIHFLGVVFNRGWIEKVQVVQEDFDRVTVRIVPDRLGVTSPRRVELERAVRLVMGEGCVVRVDCVDNIEPLPSGKYAYTVCRIPAEHVEIARASVL